MRHQAMCFLLQRLLMMKSLASLVTILLMWLSVYPVAAAARVQASRVSPAPIMSMRDEAQWAQVLKDFETLLAKLSARVNQGDNPKANASEFQALRQRLDQADPQLLEQFARVSQQLQADGLPERMRQRHVEAVTVYRANMQTLRGHLDAIEAAPTAAQRHDLYPPALADLRSQPKAASHRPADPHPLPFRLAQSNRREPITTREAFEVRHRLSEPLRVAATHLPPGLLATPLVPEEPTPADLAETEEVRITDDIRALAAELHHHPVEIYNWVHDHIEFVPTYGAIQSAPMTLANRRSNAFDTSSLLVALLRAAHIPARYAIGTVEIPADQAINWVGGVSTPEEALEALAQGGIPVTGRVRGGAIEAIRLEHVWVEAWVDFDPSFGTVNREGDTWVPMDGAFKRYDDTPGLDWQAELPFEAQGVLDHLTDQAQMLQAGDAIAGIDQAGIEAAWRDYQSQVDALLDRQSSGATLNDLLAERTIVPSQRTVLGLTLPYPILATGARLSTLEPSQRHTVQINLFASDLDEITRVVPQ